MDPQIARSYDLGRMDYDSAYALQRAIQEEQVAGRRGATVLVVEHPATVTLGRRGSHDDVVAPTAVLAQRGVRVVETDRGGQVTYHGPGQLVCYPLVQVAHLGLHVYMRALEEAVMKTLLRWNIEGYRVEGRTGVWVGKEKICAMGIRVRKWWSLHGLALNITTDLNHFGLIIPCGIRDRGVCSMRKILGAATPEWATVREELLGHLARELQITIEPGNPAELTSLVSTATG